MDGTIIDAQLKALYSSLLQSIIGVHLLLLISYYVFSGHIAHPQLYPYSVGFIFITYLLRLIDTIFYFRHSLQRSPEKQFRIYAALAYLSALSWAIFFLVVFPETPEYQVLISMIIACVATAAITTLSYSLPIIHGYFAILFSPVIYKLYIEGTDIAAGMSVLFIIFFIFIISSSIKIHRNFINNIQARLTISQQNKALSDQQFAMDKHAIVSTTDVTGNILQVNEKFCVISQYSKEELIGENHRILRLTLHDESFFKEMWETISSGEVWQGEIQNMSKDGSYYWIDSTIVPLLDKNGTPKQYIAISTDITHHKELQLKEQLARENTAVRARVSQALQVESTPFKERLEKVLSIVCSFSDLQDKAGMFLHDEETKKLNLFATVGAFSDDFLMKEECIDVGECLCGLVALSGMIKVSDNCFTDHEHTRSYDGIIAHGHYIIPIKRFEKILGVIFIYTEPYPSRETTRIETLTNIGQLVGLAVSNEYAHRLILEEKLNAEKANKAKSQFLSSMSHELRTPLHAILGFGQLMQNDDLTTEQAENVSYIVESGSHLLSLINEVLELSTIEAGKIQLSIEKIELIDVINECLLLLNNLALEKNISLTLSDTESSGITVNADYTKLKQIIINIVTNAIKYNQEHGSVIIKCQLIEDSLAKISVTDTGIGIASSHHENIFTPFERVEHITEHIEGTGIGLAVTKELVELMSGTIGFDSVENEGSTFWFSLPLFTEAGTKEKASLAAGNSAHSMKELDKIGLNDSSYKILYIEDNPANARLMEAFLDRYKQIELHIARTAELGLEMLSTQQFNLILMDINLPGMNGIELTALLRQDTKHENLPIIAITASAMTHNIKETKGLFDHYITKPIDFTSLATTLSSYI